MEPFFMNPTQEVTPIDSHKSKPVVSECQEDCKPGRTLLKWASSWGQFSTPICFEAEKFTTQDEERLFFIDNLSTTIAVQEMHLLRYNICFVAPDIITDDSILLAAALRHMPNKNLRLIYEVYAREDGELWTVFEA